MRYIFFSFIHNVITHPLLFIADVLDWFVQGFLMFRGNTLPLAMPLIYVAEGITWLHDKSADLMAPPERLTRIPDLKEPYKLPPELQKIADSLPPSSLYPKGGISTVAHVKMSDFDRFGIDGDGFARTMGVALKALDDQQTHSPNGGFESKMASHLKAAGYQDFEEAKKDNWRKWCEITRRDEA